MIDFVFPFFNLQPGIYWSGSSGGKSGFKTFSFNTGDSGSNTTDYNFLHALPVTADVLGPLASGPGTVLPYTSGPAAGKAVYDSKYKLSWPLDANLAAADNFGFTASVTLTTNPADPDVNHTQFPMTVPMIDKDGGVHFSALCAPPKDDVDCPSPATGWIVSMNSHSYAGSSNWRMPQIEELQNLYADMKIVAGDPRLESFWFSGRSGNCSRAFTGRANAMPAPPTIRRPAISRVIRASPQGRTRLSWNTASISLTDSWAQTSSTGASM